MVFNVILLLFVNHSNDFCDLQTAWRLVLSMKPWSYIWLEFGFFNNYSNHRRMCVLSTLCGNVDKHSPFDIYIYIYINSFDAMFVQPSNQCFDNDNIHFHNLWPLTKSSMHRLKWPETTYCAILSQSVIRFYISFTQIVNWHFLVNC